ncbi:SMI1/KNR4 family protein [Variovorax sp. RT4R15]|uniref:SMI1/KNR4 family protein n=1 Tax=Variovorax sp. RT4R15 TaxID=3443737 RepID=UPI003F46BE6C
MPFDVDERFVEAAERALGVRFPTSYREAMKCSNGGSVDATDDDWELHPIADDSDRKRLARTSNSVVHETHRSRGWPGFPQNAVAVGRNGAGDVLVLLGESGKLGNAFFVWLHETGELTLVADDFSDFAVS